MFFDIGAGEMIGLAVLAVILVGPERLPRLTQDLAKIVRKLRQYAQSATGELRENLGPGFEDLQPSDLNPKKFIQRQVSQALENEDSTVQDLKDVKAAIDPDLL